MRISFYRKYDDNNLLFDAADVAYYRAARIKYTINRMHGIKNAIEHIYFWRMYRIRFFPPVRRRGEHGIIFYKR